MSQAASSEKMPTSLDKKGLPDWDQLRDHIDNGTSIVSTSRIGPRTQNPTHTAKRALSHCEGRRCSRWLPLAEPRQIVKDQYQGEGDGAMV